MRQVFCHALRFLIGALQVACAAWCAFCLGCAGVGLLTDLPAGDGERWTVDDRALTAGLFIGLALPAVVLAGVAARLDRRIKNSLKDGRPGFEVLPSR